MPAKKVIHQKCYQLVEERISKVKIALQTTQQAANNETKSSAGDKHETGRAMAQLEVEKLTQQLHQNLNLKATLNQINPKTKNTTCSLGSLVVTNRATFYISVGIGKIVINHHDYFIISVFSPIGKLLLTKKEKESFLFNGTSYVIEKIN